MPSHDDKQRPAIPADLKRKVLVEAGHRCAIPTCRHIEVEVHHIIPWAERKEHKYENLIALCPNCHSLADRKKILLIHEAQQGCRDATYEPSRFPVAVPYPSPHRATPAYVVVTSSDLDTSRNKASVRGLSWISRKKIDRKSLRMYKLNLRTIHDKYSQLEIDVLFEANKIPIGQAIQWPPFMNILIRRIVESGFVNLSQSGGGVFAGGMQINPLNLTITQEGRDYIQRIDKEEI